MIFNINPCSKPRQTRADKWKKRPCVMKYRAFADELRLQAKAGGYELGETLNIYFYIPMPKSWSKKKKELMNGKPHKTKPDIDNLLKAFMDALAKDDSFVWRATVEKSWSDKGEISVFNFNQ